MILAAATEPNRGWAGPIALLVAFVIFRVVVMPAGRWVMDKIGNSSPTPALPTAERVKVHSTVGVTDDEPTDEPEIGWWGQIREIGGVRFRQAEQVWKTGSSEPPPAEDVDELDDIDLPLDEDDKPDTEEQGETAEEYIAHARELQVPYRQIVKVVMANYKVSESTAKRRVREVDEARRT